MTVMYGFSLNGIYDVYSKQAIYQMRNKYAECLNSLFWEAITGNFNFKKLLS